MKAHEAILHQQVCDYLRYNYRNVIFRTDFAAGIKMTVGQAVRHKRLQSGRAWPDLFIAEPKGAYHGLFIELKAKGTVIYKQDGTPRANAHLQEQAAMLSDLTSRGYKAQFAVGFDEARAIIDDYLM